MRKFEFVSRYNETRKLINEDGTIRIFIYYNENLENNEEGIWFEI